MQCEKFEQRLQQLLDERATVEQDELLHEHAQACDACGRVLHAQGLLFSGLRSLPQSDLTVDLGPRVLDQLRSDRRKQTNRRRLAISLAVAVMLMIALLPFAGDRVQFRNRKDGGNGRLALVTGSSSASSSMVMTERESEDIRLLMRQWMLRISDHRLDMFEPVDQLAGSIRPLAITFNFAFDTLRRTFPGYSERPTLEPQARHNLPVAPIS